MSFADRVLLWLHIAFVIFGIGPVTAATMSAPRYIRARNLAVTGYLYGITRIFSAISLGVLLFGIVLADMRHEISAPWVTISMTLYVVAAVLLVLIMRDQHKAIRALRGVSQVPRHAAAAVGPAAPGEAEGTEPEAAAGTAREPIPEASRDGAPGTGGDGAPGATGDGAPEAAGDGRHAGHVAAVERGRIASMAGVVSLIWLVILALMVWHP